MGTQLRKRLVNCSFFGGGASLQNVDNWLNNWSMMRKDVNLCFVLAGSKTAEVEGVSAAGSTALSRRYTALADAELLLNGPSSHGKWPLPPLPGGVTPALISHVAVNLLGFKPLVFAIGLNESPSFPHLLVESPLSGPADCLSTGKAMGLSRVERLWQKGIAVGLKLTAPLILAECVPGGTTTALAVLTGLGLPVGDLISGSLKNPPTKLKKDLVAKGLENASLGPTPFPKQLLSAIGDPFQAFSVGLVLGARQSGQPILLGGGSQMLAVLAIALATTKSSERPDFVKGISIGTTAWLAEEKISAIQESSFICLINLLEEHYNVNILGLASGLRFHNSSKKVLRDYERGYIKEGLGVGALILLAQAKGISCQQLLKECELAVNQLESSL